MDLLSAKDSRFLCRSKAMPVPGYAEDGDGRQSNFPRQLLVAGGPSPTRSALDDNRPIALGAWIEDNSYDSPNFAVSRADHRNSIPNHTSAPVRAHASPPPPRLAPYRSLQNTHQAVSHDPSGSPQRGTFSSVSSTEERNATEPGRDLTSHNDNSRSPTTPVIHVSPTHHFSPEIVSESPSTSTVKSDSLPVSQINADVQDIACATNSGSASARTATASNLDVPDSNPAAHTSPLLKDGFSEEFPSSPFIAEDSAMLMDSSFTSDESFDSTSSNGQVNSTQAMNGHHSDSGHDSDHNIIDLYHRESMPHSNNQSHYTPPRLSVNTEAERRNRINTIPEMQETDINPSISQAHAYEMTSRSTSALDTPHYTSRGRSPTANHNPRPQSVTPDGSSRSQSHVHLATSNVPPTDVTALRGGLYDDPLLRLPTRISPYQVVPASHVDINPNDILDDGDDGFITTKRKNVLGLPMGSGRSNNTSHSTLLNGKLASSSGTGSTINVPQTTLSKGSTVGGSPFSTTSVNESERPGGSGMIECNPSSSASPLYNVIMTERSDWLDKDKSSRRRMRYILCGIFALIIIAAVVGGVVGGILHHRHHHKSHDDDSDEFAKRSLLVSDIFQASASNIIRSESPGRHKHSPLR